MASGQSAATVIDTIWLDSYKELKGPVFNKNLKVLQESPLVPPPVVVYKKGLAQPVLNQVREGLTKLPSNTQGRDLLKHWHIDSFEPVPGDFDQQLATLLKEYPVPEALR